MKRKYVAAVHCLVRQLVLVTLDDYAGKSSAPGLLVSSDHRAYAPARSKTTPTIRMVQISFVVSGRSSSLSRFFNATSFGRTNIQKPRSIETAAPQMKMNRSTRASGDRFSPRLNFGISGGTNRRPLDAVLTPLLIQARTRYTRAPSCQ